jgi:hypothetical protein
MEILCVFLYDAHYLEDFLTVLIEDGLEDVVVGDVEELRELAAFRMPLFRELQGRFTSREFKLILALVENEKQIQRVVDQWFEDIPLKKEEVATIFSLPVKLWHQSPHFY